MDEQNEKLTPPEPRPEQTPPQQTPDRSADTFALLRVAVAVYLVYLGGDLGLSALRGETASKPGFLLAAILFLAAGAFFLRRDLPALWKRYIAKDKD